MTTSCNINQQANGQVSQSYCIIICSIGSDEGELLRKEANYYKERGNKAFADKAYEMAGTLYTDGLNVSTGI